MSRKNPTSPLVLFSLALGITGLSPSVSQAHKKQRFAETGKLVEMQDVPCGTRQKGLAGLGNIFASVGVTDVNAKDKLCQEYVLRTVDEEYRIRPVDDKHPVLLPIGAEGQFRISKDRVLLRVPEGDGKVREYQVVAMRPLNGAGTEVPASASYRAGESQPAVGSWTATLDKGASAETSANPPIRRDANSTGDNSHTTSDPAVANNAPASPDPTPAQVSDASARYRSGMLLGQQGDINGAVTEFRKAIEAKPNDPRAHAALAAALERRGDSEGALKEYGLALKLDPDDPAIRANYDRLQQATGENGSGSGS
jgi:tetratricopeptide (TPR) repeat protein